MNKPISIVAIAAAMSLAFGAAHANDSYYSSKGSMSNYGGSSQSAFERADTNGDGHLSPSEFEAMQASSYPGYPAPRYQSGSMSSSKAWNALKGKTVGDIEDMDVINDAGAKIGEVDQVVLNPRDNRIYAVVSIGGFLGIGNTELTLPLDQMGVRGDRLVAHTMASKQQLKNRRERPEVAYRDLDEDQVIGEVTGMYGPGGRNTLSFDQLDRNNDGYISRQEARRSEALADTWHEYDQDRNNKIDPTEFSAFEAGQPPAPGGWPGRGY